MTHLANIYRGTLVESFHSGSIAVVDSYGHLLACAGEPHYRTWIRSAAKPFQAIPLLEYGGIEEFGLTGEEIALTCASHGGEPIHVSTAAAMLRKGDFDESDLLCGAHMPYDEKAAADLRAAGEEPSPLHNNCSGKHAGMLLATKVMDVPSARYTDPEHPLQVLMRTTLGEFAGVAADVIPIAVDGCGVPAFYLSLYRAAYAYARLMATSGGSDIPGALERYCDTASTIVEAMTTFPQYVAGGWSLTTPLLRAFGGELLAKEGAEGFYAMALAPSLVATLSDRLRLTSDAPIGVAIKIDDGSMGRARNAVILRTLELLGIELDDKPDLEPHRDWFVRNVAGMLVGEIRPEFDLHVL
ncbi:MAG TPA: asparaginase [Thermoanaerobaculia bacterium]|nr:asparaginase [Thermoanaerobaculia bacterium]